jgi:hypothetical protein
LIFDEINLVYYFPFENAHVNLVSDFDTARFEGCVVKMPRIHDHHWVSQEMVLQNKYAR